MRLGQLITSIQRDLPVTPRHEAWLAENPNLTYTEEAKSFLASEIGKRGRDRSASFSASSAGMCHRRRLFGFLGLSETRRLSGRTTSIFHNGTWMHLRWQMAGFSAGWLARAEVPSENRELLLKGTLDGVLDTGEGLELKSINSNGFNYVSNAEEPKRQHLGQVAAYFLTTDLDAFSLIYENKDTQDYKEFVVARTPGLVDTARAEFERLAEHVAKQELPRVKDLCQSKQGPEYAQCPYKNQCLTVKSWSHTQELVAQQTSPTNPGSRSFGLRLRRTSSSPSA